MIDTHVHVYSDDVATYPNLQPEELREQMAEVPSTADGVLGLMEGAGVRGACAVQALAKYGDDNSYVVDTANAHPERFVSVVYVSPQDPDPVGRLDTWIAQGAVGIRLSASGGLLQAENLAQSGVRALVTGATERRTGVIFHLHFDEVPQLRALLEDVPDLRLALDHCAGLDATALRGGPPYRHAAELVELAAYPGVHLKVTSMAFDEALDAGVDPRALVAFLAETFGVERLMWGSDWSHTRDRPYEALADLARHACSELSTAEQDLILDANAVRFWPGLASLAAATPR